MIRLVHEQWKRYWARQTLTFKSHVHWVFITKYRRHVFDTRAINVVRGIFADVCSDVQVTLVELDGERDHMHLLVEYPPKVAVS